MLHFIARDKLLTPTSLLFAADNFLPVSSTHSVATTSNWVDFRMARICSVASQSSSKLHSLLGQWGRGGGTENTVSSSPLLNRNVLTIMWIILCMCMHGCMLIYLRVCVKVRC